jgi:tryptophanase
MSAEQWAAIMRGDESYSGSKSYFQFQEAIQDLTGYENVIPTHQGRSAEHLLMKALLKPGQIVIGNTHFDTTRANIESAGGIAQDLPCPSNKNSREEAPFKGNMDNVALRKFLEVNKSKTALIIMTVTNNSVGGQPVSLANMKETRALANEFGIPLYVDAARFAENAYFIKTREPQQSQRSVKSIAQEFFSYGDGAMMSMKKDAFANIGGFLAMKDQSLAETVRSLMVITEGFPTYGGLAGRDLEALAQGLKEVVDENYLCYRIRSLEYFGKGIEEAGFSTVRPWGGHAVYIDAALSLPHIPALQYPGQSLAVALYEHVGIRGVEVGTVMLGSVNPQTGVETAAPKELVRLALPRRVYTQSHVDYMIEMIHHLKPMSNKLRGFKITKQPQFLRHFTCQFEPLS